MVTLEDARAVAKTVAQAVDPVCIVVFGSVAREGRGHDLDLLIVTEDQAEDAASRFQRVHKHLKSFYSRFAIDPFVVSRSAVRRHFLDGSPFLRMIQLEGRCLYMKESAKQWVSQAAEDLAMAKYLLQGRYYRGACYHGQQAVEKTLKAALVQKGWELEKIHSVERLVAISRQYGFELDLNEEDAVLLDSIYRGRYPAEEGLLPSGEPGQTDAERVVRVAGQVLDELFPGSR
jgi:HEPN domain-containing protein/predicted nucleotidyltransferase